MSAVNEELLEEPFVKDTIDPRESRNVKFVRKIILGTAVSALVDTVGITAPVNAVTNTLVLTQEAPFVKHNEEIVEIGKTDSILYFEASLRTNSRKRIGLLSGQTSVINLSREGADKFFRYRELVFALDGGQIVALGTSIYASQGTTSLVDPNAPVATSVVGGTGKYRSAQGEVTTTKRADGSCRHVIILDK